MKYLFVAIAIAAASAVANAQPIDVAGVEFQPTAQVGGELLQLNGAGLRKRAFIKVYAGGLYVPQKAHSAEALLAQTGPRRVVITMLRGVDGATFSEALFDGLQRNHTPQQLSALGPRLETLRANLTAIGDVASGAVIHFEFTPQTGTRIVVDGVQKGSAIPGNDLFTAVLRNWIGEAPVDADLKAALIGL